MANVTGSCSVSLALTPSPSGGLAIAGACLASVTVTPLPTGQRFSTYVDDSGQRQSIYIVEARKESRHIEQSAGKLRYRRVFRIHGTKECDKCLDLGPQVGAVDDLLPQLVVKSRSLQPYAMGGGEADIVELTVDYEEPERATLSQGSDAEATVDYSFGGESEHIDVALAQTTAGKAFLDGETKLINYDGETVGGVDIDAPTLEFSEKWVFTESAFSPNRRTELNQLLQSVNSQAFREWKAGEVRFTGMSATKQGTRWYATFTFRVRANVTGKEFQIINDAGAAETVKVDKKGWEYLWVRMEKRAEGTDKVRLAVASVSVAQVYATIDFAVLGIGTKPLP